MPSAQVAELVKAWPQLRYHPEQWRFWSSEARFRILYCGRRSGKTDLNIRDGIIRALTNTRTFADYPYWCVFAAPTRPQVKRVYWTKLKRMVPSSKVVHISETELTIFLKNGSEISLIGLDSPERAEGRPIDDLHVDEFANVKPMVWKQNLRPALSTEGREGRATLYGVPRGGPGSHMHQTVLDFKDPANKEADAYHWKSSDILPKKEIAQAKRDLDPLTYAQEFDADFTTFEGRAYPFFDRDVHAAERVLYDERLDLHFCFDFNRSPGIAAVGQEQPYKGPNPNVAPLITAWIDEVWIPRNSTTRLVTQTLIETWHRHPGHVYVHGDSTGGVKGTYEGVVPGNDWSEIDAMLSRVFGDRYHNAVQTNPPERVRVNTVNARTLTVEGVVRQLVDSENCTHIIDDFESVTTIPGTPGFLDKNRDSNLTHLTDAIGYYLVTQHPIVGADSWEHHDLNAA